ncbi:hypothetical protein H6F67_12515 [Microcoleus sp. FACHB-1515]|uniref:hypothetical protein n=1 Tax=Cyanophyceae TaxID=3028117 RepID=UPI001681DB99|nr:hypothetical protein [Microcoleus sp. FACHB-1515]MBD2090677.1 hypothetical protein [Microcoleus sp. FACHB-1515]
MQDFDKKTVLAAIAKTVEMGQRQFQHKFPGQSFESMRWDINGLEYRNTGRRFFLNFNCHANPKQVIPNQHYVNLAKTWLLFHATSTGRMTHRLTALQVLWQVLSSNQNDYQDEQLQSFPWWEYLCKPLMTQVEDRMRGLWTTGATICEHTKYALAFIHFLETQQICFTRIEYDLITPYGWRKENNFAAREDKNGAEATKKLLSEQAIKGLGQVYRLTTDPAEHLLLAIVIIVLLTGLRIGEALTLPEHCIIRKRNQQGNWEYGLRFYEEKKHPGQTLAVKPLLPNTVELILQIVGNIQKMTAPWRQQAVVLENNSGRVPLPGFENQQLIESRELAALLGFKQRAEKRHYHLFQWVEKGKLPEPKQSDDRFYFSVLEVEQSLAEHLLDQLWTVNLRTGKYQLLSETLFIVPANFLHKRWNSHPLIIRPVQYDQVYFFLSGSKSSRSVFERYNICEADGTLCQLHTRQARTTMVTIAHEGGASLDDIARWIGHRNSQTTEVSYLVKSPHKSLSMRDRVQQMHEAIRQGRVNHTITRIYESLSMDEREVFLQAELLVLHVTQWNYCKRNFVIGCDRHLFCPGCPDQIEVGEKPDTESLEQIRDGLQLTLQEAQNQAIALGGQIAGPQLRLWQQMSNYVEASLSSKQGSSA